MICVFVCVCVCVCVDVCVCVVSDPHHGPRTAGAAEPGRKFVMVEHIQLIDNADKLTANQNTWSEYVLNMRLKFAESFVHLQLEGDAREHR